MAERRRKRGRPQVLRANRAVPVKIENAEIERARKLARREGITIAEVIRRALRTYLNRRRV